MIDQLEELFTLTTDETERTDFLECVRVAWVDPDSRVRVIATLRADFYDRPLVYPRFGRLLASRTETVAPLQPDELEQAIRGPAERVRGAPRTRPRRGDDRGRRAPARRAAADPVHVDRAVRSARRRRDDARRPTASSAASWGRLSTSADEVVQHAGPDERRAIRQVLLRLVALGEGRPDTRRRVARSTLDALDLDPVGGRPGPGHVRAAADPDVRPRAVRAANRPSRSRTRRSWMRGHDCAGGSTRRARTCAGERILTRAIGRMGRGASRIRASCCGARAWNRRMRGCATTDLALAARPAAVRRGEQHRSTRTNDEPTRSDEPARQRSSGVRRAGSAGSSRCSPPPRSSPGR